ncbi:MAG: hypothetical protein AAFV62_01710 [Pseudomonadota bacterium]
MFTPARIGGRLAATPVVTQKSEEGVSVSKSGQSLLQKMVSEPLLHFAVIGLILFLADRALSPGEIDPNIIRIDQEVQSELASTFKTARGRLPTRDEMDTMVERFVLNETLYREARALELDHGDEMMRERLAQQMRMMVYNGIDVPTPTNETLRPWVAERIDRYKIPAKLSLRIIGIDAAQAEAEAVAEQANALQSAGEPVEIQAALVTRLKLRPRPMLVLIFGEDIVAEIEAGERGVWHAVETPRGWQAVALDTVVPEVVPSFEETADRARHDYTQVEIQRLARDALTSLQRSYAVERLPYDEALLHQGGVDDQAVSEEGVDDEGVNGESVEADASGDRTAVSNGGESAK